MLFLYISDDEENAELTGYKSEDINKLLLAKDGLPENLKWTIGNHPINYNEDEKFWILLDPITSN